MSEPRPRAISTLLQTRDRIARRILLPVQAFIQTESAGGIVILAAAIAALIWANSPWDESYGDFWHTVVSINMPILHISQDLQHWVNDGAMTIFFFVVGLEIKRELLHGELAGPRKAALPAAAALGGMALPALIFTAFNAGGDGARGWGIPMATDIAFSLGVLALLGTRIPSSLRIFLLALAIVDDVGAILVIGVFYSESIQWDSLAMAALFIGAIIAMQRSGVRTVNPYWIAGACLWVAVFESGVHATIAGVALGLMTPARAYVTHHEFANSTRQLLRDFDTALAAGDEQSTEAILGEIESLTATTGAPLERLERMLHPWSSFVVIPLFALANAGIDLSPDAIKDASSSPVTLGVFAGLLAGKLAGILGATALATALRLGRLPSGVNFSHIAGVSLLGGIGFTVSLFITGLAYDDPVLITDAKMGTFAASVIAGAAGYAFLSFACRHVRGAQKETSARSERRSW
jgi:NhaA family Na+:H+ antiporter